jgi:hypothetical protein
MTAITAIAAAVIVAAIALGVTWLISAPASNPKPAATLTVTPTPTASTAPTASISPAPSSVAIPPAITTSPSRRADARQCTSTDVTARFDGGNGAGGHSIAYVRFTNTSDTTCVLKGYPTVVASQAGKPDVTATHGSFFAMPSSANMAPAEITTLGIETDTYCVNRPTGGGSSDFYQHLSITLPGGGMVDLIHSPPGFDVTCGLKLTTFWTN